MAQIEAHRLFQKKLEEKDMLLSIQDEEIRILNKELSIEKEEKILDSQQLKIKD